MLLELCRMAGRRARVVNNDLCFHDFVPENPSDDAMIVWNVCDNHCFFDEDTSGAQLLKVMPPKDYTTPVLQTRQEFDGDVTYARVEFKDMEVWDPGRFMELYQRKLSGHFHTDDIEAVAAWLRWKKVQFFAAFRDPNHMKSIAVPFKHERTMIRIKDVPSNASLLEGICEQAAAKYQEPFPYYGDNWGGLAMRIGEFLCMKHRPKGKPSCDTSGLCTVCGDPLGSEVELHRPVQPMRGGEEVVPIHPECHAWITGLQKMGSYSAGALSFYSELSPEEAIIWEQTPKPRQIHWGDGAEGSYAST